MMDSFEGPRRFCQGWFRKRSVLFPGVLAFEGFGVWELGMTDRR